MGPLNDDGCSLKSVNYDNIQWAIDNVDYILQDWGSHPAVAGIEPLNEPWWCSDLPLLKDFYRKVRTRVHAVNPDLKFVFHDAFHGDANTWNDLFADDDIKNVVMDTHFY